MLSNSVTVVVFIKCNVLLAHNLRVGQLFVGNSEIRKFKVHVVIDEVGLLQVVGGVTCPFS